MHFITDIHNINNYIRLIMILGQQHTGTTGNSVPIGGGLVHPTASHNPVAGSASHGVGTSGIGLHGAPGANHSSSLLWTKTQQLPEEIFRQVSQLHI